MRDILVIEDFDLIHGDTCKVGLTGYKSAEEAYYAARREARKTNRASSCMTVWVLDVVFLHEGRFYPITLTTYSKEVEEFLARAAAEGSRKKRTDPRPSPHPSRKRK